MPDTANAYRLVELPIEAIQQLPNGELAAYFTNAVLLKQKTCISHDPDMVYLPSCEAVTIAYDRLEAEIERRGKRWVVGLFGGQTWLEDAAGNRNDRALD